jgi:hypothetical protein
VDLTSPDKDVRKNIETKLLDQRCGFVLHENGDQVVMEVGQVRKQRNGDCRAGAVTPASFRPAELPSSVRRDMQTGESWFATKPEAESELTRLGQIRDLCKDTSPDQNLAKQLGVNPGECPRGSDNRGN